MGLRVTHVIDSVEINPPNNYSELEIELNYDGDGNKQALSINDWELGVGDPGKANDGMILSRNRLLDQSGLGSIEGLKYQIYIDNEEGVRYTLFDGYLDLWKAKYDRGKITASAVQTGKIDWINDFADSFTYDFLYNSGFFSKDKFISIPYVVVKKQDTFEIAMTLVTVFILTDKLQQQIAAIAQLAASTANPLEMSAIVRFVLQIIYLISLFISLIALLSRLFYMLMPPVKYHNGMYVKDLFEIACAYMGFTFKSSILQSDPFNRLVIIPEKFNLTQNTGILAGLEGDFKNNNEKLGYFKGTFGDLLRAFKTMFYAKIVIDNGVLYFEPWDFRLGVNGINVPYSFDNEESFSLNYDEFYATMILSFLTDLSDRHTIQEYKGTSIQITQTPKVVVDIKKSLCRGLSQYQIPFALAKKKTELTLVEKILSDFITAINALLKLIISSINLAIKAINALIRIINKILQALATIGIKIKIQLKPIKTLSAPNTGNLISNRIGMLKMESDYVSIPKLMLLDKASNSVNTKLSDDNVEHCNAGYLWDNFHYPKSFVSVNGKQNGQYLYRESDKFPFSFADFERSLNNNSVFTSDGLQGRAKTLKFNPYKQYATCSYRINKTYLSNIKEDRYEPEQ